jgi:UDP-2,3-diacylglucosamine pyrophosphatase LpxH
MTGEAPECSTGSRGRRPVVVIADAHVGVEEPKSKRRRVEMDLARVIADHSGAEIVLAGDIFDLSFAPSVERSGELLGALLDESPNLLAALRNHLAAGHPVTIVPGNHDAALANEDVGVRLRSRLDVQAGAPFSIHPWFLRRGDVHIEHGHAYDPDNAPIHPLASWDAATEPLGIQLTRHFVSRIGAGVFSHAQDSTPLESIIRAFRAYGPRAPLMIAQYFDTAIRLCIESGPRLQHVAAAERRDGEARLPDFAEMTGLPPSEVAQLEAERLAPTHLSRGAMFSRMYFDRVVATLLLTSSVMALPRRPSAGLMAVASLAYLAGSWSRGHNRYAGMAESYLRDAAGRVRDATRARLVVFGHTHLEEDGEGYANTGTFGFPRQPGRPYLLIGEDGTLSRRRALAGA